MDNEQARFLLSAARANGADARDPRIVEALAHAQRDPELARWLKDERAFDEAVVRKLQHHEPPAYLRARLIADARAGQPPHRRSHLAWRLTAAAAAVAIMGGSAWWWRAQDVAPTPAIVAARPPLLDWQKSCLGIFADPNFALDLMDGTYPPLEKFLRDRGTQLLPAPPFAPGAVELVGCKALAWQDQPVSFLCLKATTGELVHLFVVPRGTADETLVAAGPHRTAIGEFATVSWTQGDLVAMVASKMSAAQLETIIARASASLGTPDQPAAIRVASR